MAVGKQDSRQKMINMMYLVFIAMLALNISKEVLATLGILNSDIETSIDSKFQKSQTLYRSFDQNKSNPSYNYASKYSSVIKENTDSYFDYVNGIKDYLLSKDPNRYKKKVENITDSIMDYQTMDKSQYLDEYFFNGDLLTENGEAYIQRFKDFSTFYGSLVDSIVLEESLEKTKRTPHDFTQVKDLIKRSFTYNEKVINSEGTEQNYLNYNFEGFPLIASISKFTKLQSDIRELELQMVEAFNTKILSDGSAVNINTSKSLLNAKSTYFVGERIDDAKILIGRIASDFQPDSVSIKIDNRELRKGRDFTIEDGAINLNLTFSSGGEKKITGDLFFSDADGNLEPIPVDQTLVVNNRTDFFIEIPRMNILYRGLPNEIRVIDPEISQNNIRVTSSSANISPSGSSTFEVRPKDGFDKIVVNVGDRTNPRVKKSKTFRVKDLPVMESSIAYNNRFYTGSTGISKTGLQRGKVAGKVPSDFDYDLTIEVTSFTFSVGNLPPIQIKGDGLRDAFSAIESQSTGSVAFFTNVVSTAYFESKGRRVPIKNVRVGDFSIKIR